MSSGYSGWRRYIPTNLIPLRLQIWCCASSEGGDNDDSEVIVYMNNPEANAQFKYPNNFVCTSKYTIATFLPLCLLYQFTRASNVYFLINMIFSLIPGVAPVSPATAIAPLVFVLVVALIKEGVEDIKRHQADNRANNISTDVLRNGEVVQVPSRSITAGEVLKINIGEEVRADVVLLSSTGEDGQVFIDTCNLDGETNLKTRKALEETAALNSPEAIEKTTLILHTGPPNPGLFSWAGMIELNGAEVAMSLDQFLYRGAVLRNTDYVWAMVVYAGVDTKMVQNLKEKPPKSSNLDRKLNILIVIIFIVLNVCLVILASLAVWWNHSHQQHWYLHYFLDEYRGARLWGYRYLTYFILLSYFIPISLFVTTELCKVIQAQWMKVDNEMMTLMSGRWRHCQPNTSNLNEQLAMVRFIFSDKTGTLTENVMKFKRGDIFGVAIDSDNPEGTRDLLKPDHHFYDAAREYFLALAICSTIQPFENKDMPHGIIYEGSSPDEVALVETAAEYGFRLLKRSTKSLTLLVDEKTEKKYIILATLEFTPDRKMMSIIVEDAESHVITMYTKGADSFVKPQLSKAPEVQQHLKPTLSALTEMSSMGLRTLLVCGKDLTHEEFEGWYEKFVEAGKTLRNRSEVVDKVCLEMESNLRLVGVTAIEDRLQDEVPETLSFFLDAGVIVWMLTGDKRETAVTIAATSTLCDPRMDFIDHIDIGSLDPEDSKAVGKVGDDLHVVEQHVDLKESEGGKRCTLVIDGPALAIAMQHYFKRFVAVSQRVNSAVCCRLTPLQKANVVHMFQKFTGLTALAIGDGANDVSMIQEGRVGVGIIGLEGAQAALAADYAIPRFKHLRRLCAVHGRYSLLRNASCILVSFYKNIILAVIQIIFACYAGFSGQTLIDGWLLTFFNVVITSIPPFFMGIFEKDLPEEALIARPRLFTPLAHGLYFDVKHLSRWFSEAIVHAFMLFFVAYPTLKKLDNTSHNLAGSMVGTLVFCGLVLTVLTRYSLNIRYWQWLQLVGMIVSVILFFLLIFIYSLLHSLFGDTMFYWQIFVLMSNAKIWFYCLFWVGALLLIDLGIIYFQKRYFPTTRDEAERQYALEHNGEL